MRYNLNLHNDLGEDSDSDELEETKVNFSSNQGNALRNLIPLSQLGHNIDDDTDAENFNEDEDNDY